MPTDQGEPAGTLPAEIVDRVLQSVERIAKRAISGEHPAGQVEFEIMTLVGDVREAVWEAAFAAGQAPRFNLVQKWRARKAEDVAHERRLRVMGDDENADIFHASAESYGECADELEALLAVSSPRPSGEPRRRSDEELAQAWAGR